LVVIAFKQGSGIPSARFLKLGWFFLAVKHSELFICPLGAVGDAGKYTITGDVFAGDIVTRKWLRIDPTGAVPTNRAAHCAV
jgi:hypothetical protein